MNATMNPMFGRLVEIRSSLWKQGIRLLLGLALLAATIVMIRTAGERGLVLGLLCILGVQGALTASYAARELVRFGPRLQISPLGLDDRALGFSLPWSDIRYVFEIDDPGKPRWLIVGLRDAASWAPRLPAVKRFMYEIRRRTVFGPILILPLGGLAMPANDVRDLVFAYLPSSRRRRRVSPSGRREPESSIRGVQLWWLKWKFAVGRTYRFGLISVLGVVVTLVSVYEAFDRPRVIEIEGTLERVELLAVPGHLRIEVSTQAGRVVATSRRGHYRPESFPEAPRHSRVQARAFEGKPTLGLFHLTVNGEVWIEHEPLPGDAWWFGLALSGVWMLSVVSYVEYLWRWRMRQPSKRRRRGF